MSKSGFIKFLLFILLLFNRISPVVSQISPPQIINPETNTLDYCHDSIRIAPGILLQNIVINEPTEGLRISIVNYKIAEDTLVYDRVSDLNYAWKNTGSLEITGIGTIEEYQDAIRKVYYKNNANRPVLENRTFVISLLDADYLPKTGHFYRYIKNLNITWKDAKAATDSMNYYGLQGYLATIISKEENDFIWTKVDGIGWFGASDEEKEGEWKWVTGPENGQQFWQGSANGYPVNNRFSYWASGEPNNAYDGQQFAHFNQHPDKAPKSWNDMKNDGSGSDPQYYTPQGFVVEFGGMPGDPEVNLSATIEMKMNKIAFSLLNDIEICEGESEQLNLPASNLYQYTWSPNQNINDVNVSNPIVNPASTTTYKVIGQLDNCIDSLLFTVKVNPAPEINFWAEDTLEGCSPLTVDFRSDKFDEIETYQWDFGDGFSSEEINPSHTFENNGKTINKLNAKFTATLKSGCIKSGILIDTIKVYPQSTIDFDFEENECNKETANVNYIGSGKENDNFLWNLDDFLPDEIISNPGNTKGPLEFKRSSEPTVEIGLKVITEFGCVTDNFSKTWQRKPIFEAETDRNEGCPPLQINFSALASDNADEIEFVWDFGDGKTENGEKVSNIYLFPNSKYNVRIQAKSTITSCSDTLLLSEMVRTFPIPQAAFTANPNEVFMKDPVIQFENNSKNSVAYEWDFGDYASHSIQENPNHKFTKMGSYLVHLLAFNELGCLDTALQQVTVAFEKVYPPTVFSPNAKLWEDQEFRIYAEGIVNEGYEMKIFNRWGENIFTSNSQETGWDGRMNNGNFAPAGVYTWIIQYNDFIGRNHKQQGNVTLLF